MDSETARANRAREQIQSEANQINKELGYANIDQRERESKRASDTSRYAADRSYAATTYSADSSAWARAYAADASYSAAIYGAQTNASIAAAQIAEQNRHNQATEWLTHEQTAQRSEQAENSLTWDKIKWQTQAGDREAQRNLANSQTATNDALRDAQVGKLNSESANNWTRAGKNLSDVFATWFKSGRRKP